MRSYLPFCLALSACAPGSNEVTVAIANRSGEALTDVRVISGGDKAYFKRIGARGNHRVALHPGRTSDYRVTLFLTLAQRPTIWDGDVLPAGQDYFVAIHVIQGAIEARHCVQPCE